MILYFLNNTQSNIILNGTDSSGSNSGDNVITEDGFKLLQEEDTFITVKKLKEYY